MALCEQQNFLAKLFVNQDLRERFWLEPEKVGQENRLTETEVSEFSRIIEKDFNFFAESLYYKRLHEVEKIMFLSLKALGEQEFRKHFREFSKSFLPKSVKKHLEDAVEFTKFLSQQNLAEVWQKEVVRFENAKLLANFFNKSFVFLMLRYDILDSEGKLFKQPLRKNRLVVWFRLRKNDGLSFRIW